MAHRARSNSMTDALRMREMFRGMPGTAALRSLHLGDLSSDLNPRQIDEFLAALPKLTEEDIIALELKDAGCPICITPFMAILAEEETAIAMDSPAHPIEELGVTKLHQTCGHVFCRKDIKNWICQGKNTCPTCRRAFLDPPSNLPVQVHLPTTPPSGGAFQAATDDGGVVFLTPWDEFLSNLELRNDVDRDNGRGEDSNEYSGMYS